MTRTDVNAKISGFLDDNQTQTLHEPLENVSPLLQKQKRSWIQKGNSKVIHIQAIEEVEIQLQVILNLSITCRTVGQPRAPVTLHLGRRLL